MLLRGWAAGLVVRQAAVRRWFDSGWCGLHADVETTRPWDRPPKSPPPFRAFSFAQKPGTARALGAVPSAFISVWRIHGARTLLTAP